MEPEASLPFHKSLPLDTILSQMNPVPTLIFCIFMTRFNIILPSKFTRSPPKSCMHFSSLQCVLHVQSTSFSSHMLALTLSGEKLYYNEELQSLKRGLGKKSHGLKPSTSPHFPIQRGPLSSHPVVSSHSLRNIRVPAIIFVFNKGLWAE
jgi:hypothetical protein